MTEEVNDDVIRKILSCVGKKVHFTYPGDEGEKSGVLKDRVVVESTNDPGVVPYFDVVDLIEFTGDKDPRWMRIGYYRMPASRLVWGSQTTITEPLSVWRRLFVKAAKEKPWFRQLLQEVVAEIKM